MHRLEFVLSAQDINCLWFLDLNWSTLVYESKHHRRRKDGSFYSGMLAYCGLSYRCPD